MTTEAASKMAFSAPRDTEHVQPTGAVGGYRPELTGLTIGSRLPEEVEPAPEPSLAR